MKSIFFLTVLSGLLAACAQTDGEDAGASDSEQVTGEVVAEKLEGAADQSGPAAEDVLEEAADTARDQESLDPVGEPGSFAQEAMERAGEAAAE